MKRIGAIAMAAVLYHQLLSSVAPAPAMARVEPLTRITKQIHKPNMLILLDTSGSLTGVPGGSFDYTDEVGVDCDDGDKCRGGISTGTCVASNKACTSDNSCSSATCATGMAACTTDADCQPIAGRCSTGQACFVDGDCPAQTSGLCPNNGHTCDPSHSCTVINKCTRTNITCSTNADCKTGVCADGVSTCNATSDCPYATTGGTCAFGATPTGGCSSAGNCPVRAAVCSDDSAHTCTTVNDCGGTCKKAGTACNSNANCTVQHGDSCDFSGKTCSVPANSCVLPRQTCSVLYNDNVCKNTNACVPNANPCTGASTNRCMAGAAGDQCGSITTSGSAMCQVSGLKCTSDSNCTSAGDSCGPASSRMVIAKRVIRNIVSGNANVVNLGLMTFFQAGYFPYFTVGGSTTTSTKSMDIKQGTLQASGCYSKNNGPSATCTINGQTYSLKATNNAKYLIKGHGQDDKYVDATYCGWFCSIPGVGTGVFKGAYYNYTDVVPASPGAQVNFSTYQGKVFTQGGVTYRYYDSRPDYYNGGAAPPIQTVNCGSTCSTTCGARWDTQLAPFLTEDDSQTNIDATVTAFNQALEKADNGGLIAYNGTPSGCALENNVASDRNHSAYHYMQAVKNADTLSCRLNFVLFVTDGEANGPGDTNCTAAACSAANPVAAGCTCKAVLAAWDLRQNLGVKTFVVGFSTDAITGTGKTVNDNIAKAGGTDVGGDGTAPYAYAAGNEAQLTDALQNAIYQAVQGSYSTSPATASQGTTQGTLEQSGNYLLDARIDFPSWKGHLVAYDVNTTPPTLAWDAATKLGGMDWKSRKIYTSDGSDNVIQVSIDPSTGAINNKGQLFALGLGTNADEAEKIMRWTLGDPTLQNPAILGSIVNSTPIDVGAPADGTSPGLHAFYLANQSRPSVTYVGSDDGMLHAFYTKDVVINGTSYVGGNEAFAYMPRSMLAVATKLYAQGGQVADPRQHIYGLASSPKVKSICVSNCNSDSAVWKTVLVMTEGWGGNGIFMLDITNPSATQPFNLLWTSANDQQATTYNADLGFSASVPAFTFWPSTAMDDFRVIMGSGYPIGTSTTQGRFLVTSSVKDGTITNATQLSPGGTCSQDYTMLTDVGTARRQSKDNNGTAVGRKEFLAGYFGDTWGNLWSYTPTGGVALLNAFGCTQPLHFSPTVVQPDADDPNNPNAGQIYLVQVTNSSLDSDTDAFPASQMTVLKQTFAGTGAPTLDPNFGSGGKITLTAANTHQLCAETNAAGDTCLTPLPANARPLATPTGVLKGDGTGFITFSNWYVPPGGGCGKGASYLLVHDFSGSTFTLKQAVKIADEPVVNPIIVKGNLMVSASTGPLSIAGSVTTKIVQANEPRSNLGDAFQMSGWTEIQ